VSAAWATSSTRSCAEPRQHRRLALTDDEAIAVPEAASEGIPVTYVPARNTVFLSIALGWAEVLGATDIFIGVNAVDYSGYPDCRPAFIDAFTQLANVATRAGVEGASYRSTRR
jgi:7-cyano-7-deazaguanine synthase